MSRWWHPLYKALKHKNPPERYADYTLIKLLFKPVRKFVCQVIAPNCVFNNIRCFLATAVGVPCRIILKEEHCDIFTE